MDEVLVKPLRIANLRTALDRFGQLPAGRNTSHLGSSEQADESVEVDLHAALARVDGDKELFDEMTALFVEEYPKALRTMSEAISRQDPQTLAYSANALKGALGNFAAIKAIDTTARLELMGRRGDLAQAQSVLNELEKHLARLHALLTDFRLQAAA
jgi:HPt (histidine-containing phosphotransfer) domain-containing protein